MGYEYDAVVVATIIIVAAFKFNLLQRVETMLCAEPGYVYNRLSVTQ